MQRDIDKLFKMVDDKFDKIGAKNKTELENAKIKPIHDKFPYAQNGICVFIASVGLGKSYNTLKLVAKQEQLFDEPFFETVVICSTSGEFDKTTQTFKEAIVKSNLICVKDEDILSFLNEHMVKTLLYNTLMKFVKNNLKKPCDKMLELINHHRLTDKTKLINFIADQLNQIGWKTHPSRLLLIFDDFSSHPLLKHREDPLSRILKKLRHFNINVIIIVQTVKSIPKDIKRIMSDLVIFPGMSEEDFVSLIRESAASCFDYKKLWDQYVKLKDKHTMIDIHISARRIIITPPSNK